MRHRVKTKKLGRKANHRKALYKNLASSLFIHGYIKTTLAKAKAIRPYAEKIITNAKEVTYANNTNGRLSNIRNITRKISNKNAYNHLIRVWVPLCSERHGGYLRIIKIGRRPGDGAEMAYIGIVIDNSILKRYNLFNTGYKNAYRSLAQPLLQDILQPKILLDMWSNCNLPKISTEIKLQSSRKIFFKIIFSNTENTSLVNWPIFKGINPKLPLFIQVIYPKSNSKVLSFEKFNNILEVPTVSNNKSKVLLSPYERNKFIEGSLKIVSRKGNIKNLKNFKILINSPLGLLFYHDIKLDKYE